MLREYGPPILWREEWGSVPRHDGHHGHRAVNVVVTNFNMSDFTRWLVVSKTSRSRMIACGRNGAKVERQRNAEMKMTANYPSCGAGTVKV